MTSADQDEVAAPLAAGEEAARSSPPAPAAAAASPRPYYECVFCKRGFTTAQALGGHMNIHRRDRAKPSPAGRDSPAGITSVSRNVECYNKYRHLGPAAAYPHPPPPSSSSAPIPVVGAGTSSFGMIYVSSGLATPMARLDAESGSPSGVSPRELSLFGEASHDDDQDLHLGLGRHGHIAGDGSRTPARSERQQSGEPERELDLELRLGRRPRH